MYAPWQDGTGWVEDLDARTCLVVGLPSEADVAQLESLAPECRTIPAKGLTRYLHQGLYAFLERGVWHLVLSFTGKHQAVRATTRSDRVDDDSHLQIATYVYEEEW